MEANQEAKAETKKPNLYERLNAIANEVGYVNKNLVVQLGAHSYNAVGEADVLAAVKPLEKKYGVYSYPLEREIIAAEKTTDSNGRASYFERIKVTYRFLNVDNPEEHIDIVSFGDGIDPSDKSVGKAMTYADKYALLKAYKIMTGEDPDSDPTGDKTPNAPKNAPTKPVEAKTEATRAPTQPQPQNAPKEVSPQNAELPASEKQHSFINQLLIDKGVNELEAKDKFGFDPKGNITKSQASQAISELVKMASVEKKKEEVKAEVVPDDDLPF